MLFASLLVFCSTDVTDETSMSDDVADGNYMLRSVPAFRIERTDCWMSDRALPFCNKEEHACCAILPVLYRV